MGERMPAEAEMDAGYLLETFLENTPDHVYFKDMEGRFTRVSASLVRWLGVADMAQAVGRSDIDFFAASHAEPARSGEVMGIFGLARDITARKLAEQHSQQQAAELERLAAQLEQLTLHDPAHRPLQPPRPRAARRWGRGPCRARRLGALRAVHRPRRAEDDQ
jgi:hypothetical protein